MLENKKGFTLIELIIVMAIVGILAVTAIVALGSKSAEARNARRKADVSAVLTSMAMQCSETATAINCTGGTPTGQRNLLKNCTNPGTYIDLATVTDPDTAATAICVSGETTKCNYTMVLDATNKYAPCNVKIEFIQEDGSTITRNCARNTGITYGSSCN